MAVQDQAGKERIIFPLDVPGLAEAQQYVTSLGDRVGLFKVGLELFIKCGPDIIRMIRDESRAGIFLDLKLHDIPVTVERAMRVIVDHDIEMTTIHCGESLSMMKAAVKGAGGKTNVLGVTVLTSVGMKDLSKIGFGSEISGNMQELVLMRARMVFEAGCNGVVCSPKEVAQIKFRFPETFMAVTPGIRPTWEKVDQDDQKRTMTPVEAIRAGSDYLVIGRPIRNAADPLAAADRIAEEIEGALDEG
ncbi:orotidine-5'-phosphate decarboxylase [Desulfobacterales bacterium HSG17]|nr:orotidine-5'-phosphate decarboxylase [Desulfobacterales bacterium HSG17]